MQTNNSCIYYIYDHFLYQRFHKASINQTHSMGKKLVRLNLEYGIVFVQFSLYMIEDNEKMIANLFLGI